MLIILAVIAVIVLASIKQIDEYERGVKFSKGKFSKIMQPGWNLVLPIFESYKKIDIRTKVVDVPEQDVITKDNVTMSIDTVVYYQITDPFKATYEIANLVQAIRYMTTTTLRDVIGTLELDKTLSSRDDINNKLESYKFYPVLKLTIGFNAFTF